MTKIAHFVLDVAVLTTGGSMAEERNSSLQRLLEEFVRDSELSHPHDPEPRHGATRGLQALHDELWIAMHKQQPAGKVFSALPQACHLVGYRMKN